MSGATCVMEWSHLPETGASLLPRLARGFTLVDGGGDGQPRARQRTHVQMNITSRVGRDCKASCKRTSVPGAGLRRSHTLLV